MAVLNRIDADATARSLEKWLATRLPEAREVRVSGVELPPSSGMSYLSVLFDTTWQESGRTAHRRLVARLQPPSGGVFPDYDLPTEARIMRAVAEHGGPPVPRVRWVEEDPGPLGAPFLVMDRVDGRVPPDDPPYTHTGWVLDLGQDGQRRLYGNGLQALAAIARIDARPLDLEADLGRGDNSVSKHAPGLSGQLAYYRHLYEWSFPHGGHPTLEAGLQWAHEHRPPEPAELRITWGDSRIGNMIFADDLLVAAVLDWELASLASPELDLGWWQFTLRMNAEGVGAPQPPGFPPRTAMIERYEELSGHRVEHLDYYEAFGALRAAIIIGRIGTMMVDGGLLPTDSPMPISNPASNILADLLDLAPPADTVADWIGRR